MTLRLVFDESMNSLHLEDSQVMLRAVINPLMFSQATSLPSTKKNQTKSFWRSRNMEIWTLHASRFHCCSLDPSNSALFLGNSKSLTRSLSQACALSCCCDKKSGSCNPGCSWMQLWTSFPSSSDSSGNVSGATGTGSASPWGTGWMPDGMLG